MDHDLLEPIRALADPNRLRIAGACGSGSRTVDQLAGELALPVPAVRRHLDRLVAAGLVDVGPDGTFTLRVAAIHALGRRVAALDPTESSIPPMTRPDGTAIPADEAKIIRGFLRDDRLITIRAKRGSGS